MTEQANIYLYGEIGLDVDADYIRTAIADASGGIDLRINSGGGEVFEGQAIYSLLNQYKTNSRCRAQSPERSCFNFLIQSIQN